MGPELVQLLLVEDNAGDVRLTREAFKDAKVYLDLHVVSDGVEAMDFLHRRGRYADSPRPDLILLDLGLPCQDGFEVLNDLTLMNGNIRSIPIVILTGFENFSYLKNTHALYIFDYIIIFIVSLLLNMLVIKYIKLDY